MKNDPLVILFVFPTWPQIVQTNSFFMVPPSLVFRWDGANVSADDAEPMAFTVQGYAIGVNRLEAYSHHGSVVPQKVDAIMSFK
jgi:hypothetical protein